MGYRFMVWLWVCWRRVCLIGTVDFLILSAEFIFLLSDWCFRYLLENLLKCIETSRQHAWKNCHFNFSNGSKQYLIKDGIVWNRDAMSSANRIEMQTFINFFHELSKCLQKPTDRWSSVYAKVHWAGHWSSDGINSLLKDKETEMDGHEEKKEI